MLAPVRRHDLRSGQRDSRRTTSRSRDAPGCRSQRTLDRTSKVGSRITLIHSPPRRAGRYGRFAGPCSPTMSTSPRLPVRTEADVGLIGLLRWGYPLTQLTTTWCWSPAGDTDPGRLRRRLRRNAGTDTLSRRGGRRGRPGHQRHRAAQFTPLVTSIVGWTLNAPAGGNEYAADELRLQRRVLSISSDVQRRRGGAATR